MKKAIGEVIIEEIIDKEIETEIEIETEETKEIEIDNVMMISLELKTNTLELKKNRKKYQSIK